MPSEVQRAVSIASTRSQNETGIDQLLYMAENLVPSMSDEEVTLFIAMVKDLRDKSTEALRVVEHRAKFVLKERMIARNAKALPTPYFKRVKLDPQYSPYTYNLAKLQEAKKLLSPADAAKVVVHVPEYQPPVVPAHDEPGLAVSINAIIKNLGEDADGNPTSDVGKLLREGCYHKLVGHELKIEALEKAK